MDELDLLKKDWQKDTHQYNEVSEQEIYKMLHTKSSSIVKWILIISILELLIGSVLNVAFSSDDFASKVDFKSLKLVLSVITYFNFGVAIIFIFLFYKNYRKISTTVATRVLMSNILKTRKTVQYYVAYNLIMIALELLFGFFLALYHTPELSGLRTMMSGDNPAVLIFCVVFIIVCSIVFLGLVWLFYKLLYGILLKKLHTNYKELKKIDL